MGHPTFLIGFGFFVWDFLHLGILFWINGRKLAAAARG
jgi:hypothetical protein